MNLHLLSGRLVVASLSDGYGLFVAVSGSRCRGIVGRTANGGTSFTGPVTIRTWPCADGVRWQLASDNQGDVFAYGDGLLASHDGGRSWSSVREPGKVVAVSAEGRSVWLLSQSCAAGRSSPPVHCRIRLMVSADGGRAWRPSAAQPARSKFTMDSLRFAEPFQGQNWLVRTGRITGYVLLPPPEGPGHPAAPAPLLYTSDGGRSWTRYSIPCAGMPGGAVGPHQVKTVSVSANGGRTWTTHRPCPLDINKGLNCQLEWGYLGDIAAPSPGTIFMAGTALSLEVTRDGGRVWHFVQPPPGGRHTDTSEVQFFSASDGFLLGLDHNDNETPALWHTTDGGQNWQETIPVIG